MTHKKGILNDAAEETPPPPHQKWQNLRFKRRLRGVTTVIYCITKLCSDVRIQF